MKMIKILLLSLMLLNGNMAYADKQTIVTCDLCEQKIEEERYYELCYPPNTAYFDVAGQPPEIICLDCLDAMELLKKAFDNIAKQKEKDEKEN